MKNSKVLGTVSFLSLAFSIHAGASDSMKIFCKNSKRDVVKVKLEEHSNSFYSEIDGLQIFVGKPEKSSIVLQFDNDIQAEGLGLVRFSRGMGSNSTNVTCAFKKKDLDLL